eukprot:4146422-Pleurochrysis_carterae.AAC.2
MDRKPEQRLQRVCFVAAQVVSRMLTPNPDARPDIDEVLPAESLDPTRDMPTVSFGALPRGTKPHCSRYKFALNELVPRKCALRSPGLITL